VAADVGGAIKGNRIDLGHDTARGARNVGRRTVRVHILN
jgi:3D (Asp-Asp-Asp) domain-containing protein